jgi:hypothetical protein
MTGFFQQKCITKIFINQKSNNMKSRLLLILVVVLLVSCQDPSSASPTYVSPDGGAFGGGWWLIPLIGAGLGFLFMFFSFEAIKKGEFWREDDPRGPGYPPIQKRRPSTKKWYQVPTGYVAIGLWVVTIIAVIIRATTFH